MAQSYKTNQRSPFKVWPVIGLLFLCLKLLSCNAFAQTPNAPKPAPKAQTDTRGAAFFPHYEYRFSLPEDQANAVWKYLLTNFINNQKDPGAAAAGIEEEHLTDLYFDTPKRELLRQNLALRQRLSISGEGRKQHLQLLLPPQPDSVFGSEVKFRHNKRPDKGASFTNHPVLKVLRTKDRPVLDSLLRPFQIKPQRLEIVLEVNQDRRRIHLRNRGNDWLLITLTALQVQAPAHERIQLQVQADPNTLNAALPPVRKKLAAEADALAQKLQQEFPELKREKNQEYAIMEKLKSTPSRQRVNAKVVFGVSLLVLILTVVLVRRFRQKPQPFE